MAEPQTGLFRIVAAGDQWAVTTEDEVLVLTESRQDAEALAEAAARILGDKAIWRHRVPPEPRSFKAED